MQCIINIIPDLAFEKLVLYGRENILEFKQKLKIYNKIQTDYENIKSRKVKLEMIAKEKTSRSKTDL